MNQKELEDRISDIYKQGYEGSDDGDYFTEDFDNTLDKQSSFSDEQDEEDFDMEEDEIEGEEDEDEDDSEEDIKVNHPRKKRIRKDNREYNKYNVELNNIYVKDQHHNCQGFQCKDKSPLCRCTPLKGKHKFNQEQVEQIKMDYSYVFKQMFDQFFIDVTEQTELYRESIRQKYEGKNPKPWFTHGSQITIDEMKKYFSLFIHMGIVRTQNVEERWKIDHNILSTYQGKYKDILSFNKFKLIHRCLHLEGFTTQDDGEPTNHTYMEKYFGEIIKQFYDVGIEMSLDDGWHGLGQHKMINKVDRVGHKVWKLVDQNKYIYHFESEYLAKGKLNDQLQQEQQDQHEQEQQEQLKLNSVILNNTLKSLPTGFKGCIIIDSASLGNFSNVKKLAEMGHYFIVSINRSNSFDIFTPILLGNVKTSERTVKANQRFDKNDHSYFKENEKVKYGMIPNICTAIAWKAKPKKIVYFLTNIPNPLEEIPKVSKSRNIDFGLDLPAPDDANNSQQQDPQNVSTTTNDSSKTIPRIASCYNYCHSFVDITKMVINRSRNIQRQRTYSRSLFHDVFYLTLYDSFILTQLADPAFQSIFKEYLLMIANHLSSYTPSSVPLPSQPYVFYISTLIKSQNQNNLRGPCHSCIKYSKDKRIESICQCHNYFFHRECSDRFHNQHLSFVNVDVPQVALSSLHN